MINSRRNEIYNANEVVNSNDLRKRIVNVDSRFRSVLTEASTDFLYKFEHPYKNVIRMRVASVEIPNMWYEFCNNTYHNTYFHICAYDISNVLQSAKIQIPDGNYSAADLIAMIQTQLNISFNTPYGIFIDVTVDPHSIKVSFIHTGVGPKGSTVPTQSAKPFILNFKVPELCYQPFDFGLGSNLGFMNNFYNVTTVLPDVSGTQYIQTSESLLDVIANQYLFLSIDDLHGVEQKTNDNYFQCLAKIIVREDKLNVIYDDGSSLLSNDVIFPSPVDLKQIRVRLTDPYNKVIDLNYLNFSFSLEITEVMNTKMYEFYRNYIWLGTIPSVPANVTGSAQGLLGGKGP
uniref:Uncharacterized protein n=1 Tax=viral metagenome TaxID=1070528 RepID=A0A6C0AR53_9ZZZZ